jgi:hypothetical protein
MLKYVGTITQPSGETGVLEGGGGCICVKNYIDIRELWVDEDFEMIAIEVKIRDPNLLGKS